MEAQSLALREDRKPLVYYIILHLIPGLLIFIFYFLLAPVFVRLGFQSSFALHLGFLLVGMPVELTILFRMAKKKTGSYKIWSALSYTSKLPVWEYVLWIALFLIYYYGFINLVVVPISGHIQNQLFSWAPAWFLERGTFLNGTPAVWMIVLSFAVRLLIDGLMNPFTEEMYFRGYLLPKFTSFGLFGAILNAFLFSAAHFWQPFNFLTLFCINCPLQILVWKRKSIYLSIFIHVGSNFFLSAMMVLPYLK